MGPISHPGTADAALQFLRILELAANPTEVKQALEAIKAERDLVDAKVAQFNADAQALTNAQESLAAARTQLDLDRQALVTDRHELQGQVEAFELRVHNDKIAADKQRAALAEQWQRLDVDRRELTAAQEAHRKAEAALVVREQAVNEAAAQASQIKAEAQALQTEYEGKLHALKQLTA